MEAEPQPCCIEVWAIHDMYYKEVAVYYYTDAVTSLQHDHTPCTSHVYKSH